MRRRFLVIGLGRLGLSLVKNLYENDQEVIALDQDENRVDEVKEYTSFAAVGNCEDRESLEAVGAHRVDKAIVCLGRAFESALLAVTHLLEMQVPFVAARAISAQKAKIFRSVGVHQVFIVEEEMGRVLAEQYTRPEIIHSMELGSDLKLVEWTPPAFLWGKTLGQLDLPGRYRVQVLALRDRSDPKTLIVPDKNFVITDSTWALLMGSDRDLERMLEELS